MLFQKLAILSVFAALGAAQDFDMDDVSWQCRPACQQVDQIVETCDKTHDDDAAEWRCVCTAQNANTLVPECFTCMQQNPRRDSDDNTDSSDDEDDIREIMSRCQFNANQPSSASSAPPSQQTTAPPQQPSASSVVITTTSGSVVMTSTSEGPAQQTDNGASHAGAAMGLGALGFAFAMM